MSHSPPPKLPWKRGHSDSEGYDSFQLTVGICVKDKSVWSFHKPTASIDVDTCNDLPNMGLEHVSFALLTEAIRQHTRLASLILMNRDPKLLAEWNENPDQRDEIESRIQALSREMVTRQMNHLISASVKESLLTLSN